MGQKKKTGHEDFPDQANDDYSDFPDQTPEGAPPGFIKYNAPPTQPESEKGFWQKWEELPINSEPLSDRLTWNGHKILDPDIANVIDNPADRESYWKIPGTNVPWRSPLAGAVEFPTRLARGLTTPTNLALMASGIGEAQLLGRGALALAEPLGLLNKLAAMGFTAQGAHGAYEAAKNKDPMGFIENTSMAALGAAHTGLPELLTKEGRMPGPTPYRGQGPINRGPTGGAELWPPPGGTGAGSGTPAGPSTAGPRGLLGPMPEEAPLSARPPGGPTVPTPEGWLPYENIPAPPPPMQPEAPVQGPMPTREVPLDFETPLEPTQGELNYGAYRSPQGRFTRTGPAAPTRVRPFVDEPLQDTLGFTDQELQDFGNPFPEFDPSVTEPSVAEPPPIPEEPVAPPSEPPIPTSVEPEPPVIQETSVAEQPVSQPPPQRVSARVQRVMQERGVSVDEARAIVREEWNQSQQQQPQQGSYPGTTIVNGRERIALPNWSRADIDLWKSRGFGPGGVDPQTNQIFWIKKPAGPSAAPPPAPVDPRANARRGAMATGEISLNADTNSIPTNQVTPDVEARMATRGFERVMDVNGQTIFRRGGRAGLGDQTGSLDLSGLFGREEAPVTDIDALRQRATGAIDAEVVPQEPNPIDDMRQQNQLQNISAVDPQLMEEPIGDLSRYGTDTAPRKSFYQTVKDLTHKVLNSSEVGAVGDIKRNILAEEARRRGISEDEMSYQFRMNDASEITLTRDPLAMENLIAFWRENARDLNADPSANYRWRTHANEMLARAINRQRMIGPSTDPDVQEIQAATSFPAAHQLHMRLAASRNAASVARDNVGVDRYNQLMDLAYARMQELRTSPDPIRRGTRAAAEDYQAANSTAAQSPADLAHTHTLEQIRQQTNFLNAGELEDHLRERVDEILDDPNHTSEELTRARALYRAASARARELEAALDAANQTNTNAPPALVRNPAGSRIASGGRGTQDIYNIEQTNTPREARELASLWDDREAQSPIGSSEETYARDMATRARARAAEIESRQRRNVAAAAPVTNPNIRTDPNGIQFEYDPVTGVARRVPGTGPVPTPPPPPTDLSNIFRGSYGQLLEHDPVTGVNRRIDSLDPRYQELQSAVPRTRPVPPKPPETPEQIEARTRAAAAKQRRLARQAQERADRGEVNDVVRTMTLAEARAALGPNPPVPLGLQPPHTGKITLTEAHHARASQAGDERDQFAGERPENMRGRHQWDDYSDREIDKLNKKDADGNLIVTGQPGLTIEETNPKSWNLIYRNSNGRVIGKTEIDEDYHGVRTIPSLTSKRFNKYDETSGTNHEAAKGVREMLITAIELNAGEPAGMISEFTGRLIANMFKFIGNQRGSVTLGKAANDLKYWKTAQGQAHAASLADVEGNITSRVGRSRAAERMLSSMSDEGIFNMITGSDFMRNERGSVSLPSRNSIVEGYKETVGKVGNAVGNLFEEGPNKEPSTFEEAMALPGAAMTGGDVSMPLRQGLPMIFSPEWRKSLGPMFKAAWSADKAEAFDAQTRANPIHQERYNPITDTTMPSVAEEMGITLIKNGRVSASELSLGSNWIENGGTIPYFSQGYRQSVGRVYRASNRAAATFLNKLRTESAERLMNTLKDTATTAADTGRAPMPGILGGIKAPEWAGGKQLGFSKSYTPEQAADLNPYNNKKLAREIGDFINTATGRAPLKTILFPHEAAPELSLEWAVKPLKYTVFSPRGLATKVRMLNPLTYTMASPFVRKQYLKAAISAAAAWWTMTKLIKGYGAVTSDEEVEVSDDMNSSEFGKSRIGNVRMDPGGGFQQLLVLYNRLLTGRETTSASDTPIELGQGYRPPTRVSITQNFMANKMNPTAKYVYDFANASTHQPFHVGDRTIQLFTSLVMSDLYAIAQENPKLLPGLAPPIGMGMGSQVYDRGESEGKFISPENDYLFTGGGDITQYLNPFKWGQQEE